MTFSSAFHGTTNSISSRKTSRRVFFLLPAYSASAKLIWPIASTPLPDSTSHGVIGGLVQTFPSNRIADSSGSTARGYAACLPPGASARQLQRDFAPRVCWPLGAAPRQQPFAASEGRFARSGSAPRQLAP